MATRTTNYGFSKPENNDYASIEALVVTFDEIDEALKEVEEKAGDSEALNAHINNNNAHVTTQEKNTWNSKAAGNHSHSASDVGAAPASHSHVLGDLPITYGTTDLTAGVSTLQTGKIHLVYE